jgi:hypothetical protein
MRTTKAQISETKKIIFTLLVIIVLVVGVGKLFGRAKDNVENEFDPDKFFNQNQGPDDEALASGIASLLPAESKKAAQEISQLLFINDAYGSLEKGKLILLSDFNYQHPFFYEQKNPLSHDNIGMQFRSSDRGIINYLVKQSDSLESRSLFLDFETNSFLRNRQLCFLPEEIHAPFISELTGYQTDIPFPAGVTLDTLSSKYSVNQLTIYSSGKSKSFSDIPNVNGRDVSLAYLPSLLQIRYADFSLDQITLDDFILPETKGPFYTSGLLVWIYGDAICILDRSFTKDSGLMLDDSTKELNVRKRNKKISDELVLNLTKQGVISVQ